MPLHLTTLGQLRLEKDGSEVPLPVQRRLRAAVLVFFAVERDVSRERTVSVFWPDSTEKDARHSLSQTISQLRKSLGDEWLLGSSDGIRVSSYVQVDTDAFEQAVKERHNELAFELYRGAFLAGIDNLPDTHPFNTWLDARRAHFERLHRSARRHFINARLEVGDVAGALQAARDWVQLTPGEDEAQHRLIELLAASGNTIEAARQYEVYERALAADDLTPLEDTKALIARIRAQGLKSTPDVRPIKPKVIPSTGFPEDLEIIRPLGRGAVAEVLLAREPALKRLVAVKVLRSELAGDEVKRMRFEREAQAAANVAHPNVTTIYRMGRLANGVPYIVMEYVDGRTLDEVLTANGPFTGAETTRVLETVARALSAAHARGVVHRDVRTGNIMLENRTGRIVLMDFGVAALLDTGAMQVTRLTGFGELIGDPLRMSPEQRDGAPATKESDVYAMGVLACELLSGTVPRDGVQSIANVPHVDGNLRQLIARCLAVEARHRPTVEDVVSSLAQRGSRLPSTSNPLANVVAELRNRKIFRVVVAYVAAAFAVAYAVWLLLVK